MIQAQSDTLAGESAYEPGCELTGIQDELGGKSRRLFSGFQSRSMLTVMVTTPRRRVRTTYANS